MSGYLNGLNSLPTGNDVIKGQTVKVIWNEVPPLTVPSQWQLVDGPWLTIIDTDETPQIVTRSYYRK
jgi:hypothetical protein